MLNKYQVLKQNILTTLNSLGIPNQEQVDSWLDNHLEISKSPNSDEACRESVEVLALYFYCTWYNKLSIDKKIPRPLEHSQNQKDLLSAVAFNLPVEANLELKDLIELMHEIQEHQQSLAFHGPKDICIA